MFVFYRLQILQFFRKFLIFPELFGDQKDWGSRGREFKSRHSDQTMIIRTTLSKLVMCSDLSFLLKISYEMNKGGNIPTLAHFVIAMFSFDRYNIYYYFYRVPYNNAKEEQG